MSRGLLSSKLCLQKTGEEKKLHATYLKTKKRERISQNDKGVKTKVVFKNKVMQELR